jgi:hypothetical protein
MKQPRRLMLALLASPLFVAAGPAYSQGEQPASRQQTSEKAAAQQVIEEWPETASKVAREMIDKYGEPDGVTDTMLIWEENDPWVRTIVHKEEIDHNFPVPHKDVLEQFINYDVPEEKFSDLAKYDGSVVAYRTNGELSARCDKEAANILALNLAHEIVEGERSVEDARAFYAQTVETMMQGETPEYVQGLQFEVQAASDTADPDEQFEASEQMASSPQVTSETEGERGVASMTAAELTGKNVLSADGEVIGEVAGVSYSEAHGENAARIEMDGFFGIGGREVELPLSRLSMTAEGDLQTSMTDDELKSLPEIGEEIEEEIDEM